MGGTRRPHVHKCVCTELYTCEKAAPEETAIRFEEPPSFVCLQAMQQFCYARKNRTYISLFEGMRLIILDDSIPYKPAELIGRLNTCN